MTKQTSKASSLESTLQLSHQQQSGILKSKENLRTNHDCTNLYSFICRVYASTAVSVVICYIACELIVTSRESLQIGRDCTNVHINLKFLRFNYRVCNNLVYWIQKKACEWILTSRESLRTGRDCRNVQLHLLYLQRSGTYQGAGIILGYQCSHLHLTAAIMMKPRWLLLSLSSKPPL